MCLVHNTALASHMYGFEDYSHNYIKLLIIIITNYYVCVNVCMHVCMCTIYMYGTQGGQKRAPGPLELELWMVVNLYAVLRN